MDIKDSGPTRGVLVLIFLGVSSGSSALLPRWLVALASVEFSVAALEGEDGLAASFLGWGGVASLGLAGVAAGAGAWAGEGAGAAAGLASVAEGVSAGLVCTGSAVMGLMGLLATGTPFTLGTVWFLVGVSAGLLTSTGFWEDGASLKAGFCNAGVSVDASLG